MYSVVLCNKGRRQTTAESVPTRNPLYFVHVSSPTGQFKGSLH